MRVRWFGQSAFHLAGRGGEVVIDPFGSMEQAARRGMRFDYAPIAGVRADLVLVTHEHPDHNGVERVDGDPVVIRSTAGTLDSPVGEVVAVAGEHDEVAGTRRGPNALLRFALDGLRVCHLGDLGQRELRAEQVEAVGPVDLLFVPVGGGPTIGAEGAAEVVARLAARWVVPMHYRTPAVSFLEPADAFLERFERVERLEGPVLDTEALREGDGEPVVVVPAPPVG